MSPTFPAFSNSGKRTDLAYLYNHRSHDYKAATAKYGKGGLWGALVCLFNGVKVSGMDEVTVGSVSTTFHPWSSRGLVSLLKEGSCSLVPRVCNRKLRNT